MAQSPSFLLFPFLIPLCFPSTSFYLLGTLLAVIGSRPPWSQVARKLISPFPSPPHSKFPTPWGIPELNAPLLRRHRNTGLQVQNTNEDFPKNTLISCVGDSGDAALVMSEIALSRKIHQCQGWLSAVSDNAQTGNCTAGDSFGAVGDSSRAFGDSGIRKTALMSN